MNIDTGIIRSEPHAEIGTLIQVSANVLVQRWCDRAVKEQPPATRVHADVLRDQFSKFLQAIGRGLTQTRNANERRVREPALQHGEQRWDTGWSLTEVVRDYQLMQLVILEYLEETLARPLYCREMMAIGVFIDDAVAASIACYVAHRDEHVRAAERVRAEALENLNQRKDEFMAMLGHELRNPLAPMQNSVMVIRKLLGSTQPSVLPALEMLERQSMHLTRLVDDILDLSRIGRGEFELRRARVDLASVLEQTVQTSEPVLKAREHELTVSFPDTPVLLDADPDRLVQIVGNLLNNAAKYTEPGGRIWLTGAREGPYAVIRVRDNGLGIPAEMRSRVFDLFTQVEGSQQYAQGGLGIGLTLVQRLVEQHGGAIACESAGAGQGSEFIIRLPAAVADGENPIAEDRAKPQPDAACGLVIVAHPPRDKG